MKIEIIGSYRGVDIIEYQDQHHAAGRLSVGFVPPRLGKYGRVEGSPSFTVDIVKNLIDAELD